MIRAVLAKGKHGLRYETRETIEVGMNGHALDDVATLDKQALLEHGIRHGRPRFRGKCWLGGRRRRRGVWMGMMRRPKHRRAIKDTHADLKYGALAA